MRIAGIKVALSVLLLLLAAGALARAQSGVRGKEAAHQHEHAQSGAAKEASVQGMTPQEELKVVSVFRPPSGFVGNITYDKQSGRMWLLSMGPPANTKGPSKLYEVEAATGKVLAQVEMPFLGEFGSPCFIDGFLYLGIPHESKIYKIEAGDRANLGKIVKTIPLPTINDLGVVDDEVYRFPFIEFSGVIPTPEKNLLIHASDVSEFITLDKETGKVLNRVKTMRGVGGIAGDVSLPGEFLVLGNYNPAQEVLKREMRRFLFRAAHGVVPITNRSYDTRAITWVLLDTQTGSPLASTERINSSALAGSIALIKHESVPGTLYGRYAFFITGDEGILTMEWTPSRRPPL